MVAGVLGLRLGGEEIAGESVARAIGGKKLLLVLDNCEHVIDAAARLAGTVQQVHRGLRDAGFACRERDAAIAATSFR
jgi:predicted ATPase